MTGKCFVPDCKSGQDSERRRSKKEQKKHPYVFGAPKHWTMLQIWNHIIPGSEGKFSITDRVCELHFTQDYISKFHEISLEGGKVLKMERNHAKLQPGAIPTVFPNFPEYSKNVQKIVDEMRKEFPLHVPQMDIKLDEHMQSYLKIITEAQKISISNSANPEETVHEAGNSNANNEATFSQDNLDTESKYLCSEDLDVSDNAAESSKTIKSEHEDMEVGEEGVNESDDITFDILVGNLKSVSKPNGSWSITAHGKFVMCAKWNKDYQPEKRVVIDRDLNIKVFLHDDEIAAYNNCISDISDISNILSILDK